MSASREVRLPCGCLATPSGTEHVMIVAHAFLCTEPHRCGFIVAAPPSTPEQPSRSAPLSP